jgi:hypothetical protein
MALTPADIAGIEAALSGAGAVAEAYAVLRTHFPKLSLTRADESDMGMDTPFRQYAHFNLYLVDGSNHCWTVTGTPENATGLVLAAKRGKA